MKSKLLFTCLMALGSLGAQEPISPGESDSQVKQQFGYVSLGLGPLPAPIPTFGVGYRAQEGHHGADFSLQVSTIVAITQLKANLLYHHYFKPSLASEFYVGGGIGPSVVFGSSWGSRDNGFLLSPEFVFGKQYRNESQDLRFFQAQISFPTLYYGFHHARNGICQFPLLVLSYGIGF